MPAPCKNCPFLKEGGVTGLGEERFQSIVKDVMAGKYFPCHKFVYENASTPVCRGSLDFAYKTVGEEVFDLQHVRMAERFNMWDVPSQSRLNKVWDSIGQIEQ